MAVKKTVSKSSSKVKFDWSVDSKTTKKTNKELKKEIKRGGKKFVTLFLVFLLVGLLLGGGAGYFLTRNDCFDFVGAEEITLTLGESYTDTGMKVVAFGRDESDKVKAEYDSGLTTADGVITANEVGTYYIKYTVDNLKYGKLFKIQKIRLITFVESSPEDEMEVEYE